MGKNLRRLLALIICSLGLVFSFSRFVVFGFCLSLFLAFLVMRKGYKYKFLSFFIIILLIVGTSFFLSNNNIKTLLKTWYYEKPFKDLFKGSSPLGNARFLFERDLAVLGEYINENPLIIFTGSGFGYFEDESLEISTGDFGWLTFFNRVGLFGLFIIIVIVFKTLSKTIKAVKDRNMNPYLKYITLASQSYIVTSIFATFHSGAMFHSANYYFLFIAIALIAFIDEKRQKELYSSYKLKGGR